MRGSAGARIGWSLLRGGAELLRGETGRPWSSNLAPRRKLGGSHLAVASRRILQSLDCGWSHGSAGGQREETRRAKNREAGPRET